MPPSTLTHNLPSVMGRSYRWRRLGPYLGIGPSCQNVRGGPNAPLRRDLRQAGDLQSLIWFVTSALVAFKKAKMSSTDRQQHCPTQDRALSQLRKLLS